jgi:hypothetical protein
MPENDWKKSRIPYFTAERGYKRPGEKWLAENATHPHWARDLWRERIDKSTSDETRIRTALGLALGVNITAISHYVFYQRNGPKHPKFNQRLSAETVWAINQLSVSLGKEPARKLEEDLADWPSKRESERHEKGKRPRRIAVLAGFEGVPSARFHLTVLAAIVKAGERRGYVVEIHDVGSEAAGLTASLIRILRTSSLQGIVWFRADPARDALRCIASYPHPVPVVLVHSARLMYERPVIAHIVPDQRKIAEGVRRWAVGLPEAPDRDDTVVIAAMDPDNPRQSDYPPLDPSAPISIREERVSAIRAGIQAAGLRPEVARVDGYAAHYCYQLLADHRAARGYACLSDEIALGVHGFLAANKGTGCRVLGFDGSPAALHRIPTFDQHLPSLGAEVIDQFDKWFLSKDPQWDACQQVSLPVTLSGLD